MFCSPSETEAPPLLTFQLRPHDTQRIFAPYFRAPEALALADGARSERFRRSDVFLYESREVLIDVVTEASTWCQIEI